MNIKKCTRGTDYKTKHAEELQSLFTTTVRYKFAMRISWQPKECVIAQEGSVWVMAVPDIHLAGQFRVNQPQRIICQKKRSISKEKITSP